MPLMFLLRLLNTQLPVRVVEPEEIRHVSVLLATGLIEGEITILKPASPYVASRLATVTRITEAGRAELASVVNAPAPMRTSMQFTRGLRLM
jgi:hypothetical protein